ncbi:protoporphyrinogen oxidase [Actinocorallia sp. A-T 12471]|uniref:protoporphyrinogen oxidase n=1 Tax=Actinocorallia sp. A-T 12471 TaxID=3089813 RepID=UPI0029D11FD5|nr:protoporphyrinogen oxidase [Actinocorallia sp. A-T 12471]MDX6739689.1 protoporphyrinogen oxidase [Actinocorallia sp. A-T 12471]
MTAKHVVVVGGGISGLGAAWHLSRAGLRVTVLEGGPRLGGKLRVSELAGVPLDEGAESMLARRPEAVGLVAALGLDGLLRHPGTASSAIYSHGGLKRFPAGQVMGVPSDLTALAQSGVLDAQGVARAALDLARRPTPRGSDVSVADYVGDRLGREVVDRLVEPLLGGVYAGRADLLSFEATLPQLAHASLGQRSLVQAAKAIQEAAPKNQGPVFATMRDGMGSLPVLLGDILRKEGVDIRTEAMAQELRRTPDGWRVVLGPKTAPVPVEADAVVLAVPAAPAARLLAADVPAAAAELAGVEYASMAIISLAYRASAFPEKPTGSGYLVPSVENRRVKAVTFSSVKWPHLTEHDSDLVLVRASIGRFGEERTLQRPDAELKADAMAELADVCAVRELPVEARVTRWGGGLPQYNVGHLDRIARVRGAVAGHPRLAVCGAAYDGVGVPACLATAKAAAVRIINQLREVQP